MFVTSVSRWLKQNWAVLALAVLLPVAFGLRVYGLDWDRGFFFHPDERQILMVVERLALPGHLLQFFSPSSPLNPHFFAYGSLPLYLLRLLSWVAGLWRAEWAFMPRFYLIGRLLSALFDTATVYAMYLLACKVYDRRVAVLAATLVTFTVLHIQLAHFYTVDTLLTTLVLLAMNKAVDVARGGRLRDGVRLSVLFGAALATKVSVLPFGVVVLVCWMASAWPARVAAGNLLSRLRAAWRQARRKAWMTLGLALLVFFLLQPYALIDAGQFAAGVATEVAMSQGWADFPYTRQYAASVPYLYQASQILRFAMGIPLGLLGFAGLLWLALRLRRQPSRLEAVLLSWPLLYALLQGAAYAKFLRYVLPLLPFLCLAGAVLWMSMWDTARATSGGDRSKRVVQLGVALLCCLVLLCTAFYALAFLQIYAQPHPWIQASALLCQRLPEGATVLSEVWDDPLPLYSATHEGGCPKEYCSIQFDFHALDAAGKLEQLLDGLESSDYIVLSSDRLYAPISRLSQRFPLSSRYYQQLFAERLGFQLVAAPAVYPHLAGIAFLDNPRSGLPLVTPALLMKNRPPGLILDLGRADESFTVYDHPQPLIFEKTRCLSRQELRALLSSE